MKTVLFVCTGNTCRSPMAEAIFNKLSHDLNIDDVKAVSAGIAADVGAPASANAVVAAKEIGCDLTNHKARQLTPEMIKTADSIYTMSKSNAERLKQYFSDSKEKISPLGEVPDPYGGDLETYRYCRKSLLALIKNMKELVK